MKLYLMRHGKAGLGHTDAVRPLTERGVTDVKAVGEYLRAYLAEKGLQVARVHHSTLLRAKQTAQIMASAIRSEHDLEEYEGLEPWGDIEAFVRCAGDFSEDTLVCGHEPFMGQAARALETGGGEYIHVKTATVMAFQRTENGWVLDWVINPKMLKKEAS